MLKIRNLSRFSTATEPAQLLSVNHLDVAVGTCVSVAGNSGSGKTLLLRAIADLDPAEGEVFFEEVERNQVSAPVWRRQVAYVPATSGWWYDLVGDHIEDRNAAEELAMCFDLPADVFSWSVQQLSTGERQRLSLSRTLNLHPKILLLDEPTSGLDPETTEKVEAELLKRLRSGIGILLVSHDRDQRDRLASTHHRINKGVLTVEAGMP